MDKPEHYRYSDVLNELGLHIVVETFRVLRKTPCGYWVQPTYGHTPDLTEEGIDFRVNKATRPRNVRWVSRESSRRYCYPSKADAMHSYKCRKESQLKHANVAIARAKKGLAAATEILALGNAYPVCKHTGAIEAGMPPEFSGVVWE